MAIDTKYAIIMLSGSLNPCHQAHIKMLQLAKIELETRGFQIVSGFLCPSSDTYVKGKLDAWAITLEHRINLCQTLLQNTPESEWIQIYNKGLMDSAKIAKDLWCQFRSDYSNLIVYEVFGADFILKMKLWSKSGRYIMGFARKDNILPINNSTDLNPNFIWYKTEIDDISSTIIRNAIDTQDRPTLNTIQPTFEYIQNNHKDLFISKSSPNTTNI